jgi:hypothetical protein
MRQDESETRRTVEIERDRGQGAVGKGALSGAAGTLLFCYGAAGVATLLLRRRASLTGMEWAWWRA